jgi:hypothetical protein
MELSYFATDGNYGSALGLTVIDTTAWTESDWSLLDEVSDDQRALTARVISEWIESDRSDDYNQYFERLGVALGD